MMELWPFTNFHDLNLDWIIKTIKTYTKKVDDFIADINEAWQDFREWTTGEIDQMHDDFEEYVNVTEGALNTGAIANGAITPEKLESNLESEIAPLSMFDGDTDADRLYDALYVKNFKGAILGGNITISQPLNIPSTNVNGIKLANAVITLNSDMFTTTDSLMRPPSFVNCRFNGNANSISDGSYTVFGVFDNCIFNNCSLVNESSATIQSPYITNTEIINATREFIKADRVYDCHINKIRYENQSVVFMDTENTTLPQGGTQNLWVSDSIFEGNTARPFKLSGGNIFFKNNYFEGNTLGCVSVTKSSIEYDILKAEYCGNKVTEPVTAFTFTGYTNNYRVIISIHDNYYHTSNAGTPMVSGIPTDSALTAYNNRPSNTTDVFIDAPRLIYDLENVKNPTVNTQYFTRLAGGWMQYGHLVVIDMVLRAETTTASDLSSVVTDLPQPSTANTRIVVTNGVDGTSTTNDFYIAGTAGRFNGGTTQNDRYRITGIYFTNNKTTR